MPGASHLPPYIMPIARAAELGADLMPEITSVVHQFGFSSFTYWAATRSTLIFEGRTYEVTTRPSEWATRYDDKAYVEIDPRIGAALAQTLPVIWERRTWSGRAQSVDAFLDDAAKFGIGSGVCIPIHDPSFGVGRFDFDSETQHMNIARQGEIKEALGDFSLIGRFLHDLFATAIKRNDLPSRSIGMPLSEREQECLDLATRGLTTDQLARQLGIDLWMVNIHFDSIRAKLGCANRDEAIAYALKKGRCMP